MFSWLTKTQRAPRGVQRASVWELTRALRALNERQLPFVVRDGEPDDCHLSAQWRPEALRPLPNGAGRRDEFRILMRFDARRRQVRAVDVTTPYGGGVGRNPGAQLSYGTSVSYRRVGWRFVKMDPITVGSHEMKDPLIETVRECGWGWRGMLTGF